MKNNLKYYLIPIIVSIATIFLLTNTRTFSLPNMNTQVPIQYHATVCAYYHEHGTNTWKLLGCHHNTLTDIGKNFVRDQLTNPDSTKILKYISLSTSSTDCSASATKMANEITTNGLSRHECTLENGTGYGNWTCTYLFTATGTVNNVQATGLQWDGTSGSDNNLFACTNFGSVDMEANDQIKIIWTITVSEA